jgi:hypothetical protein
MNIMSEYAVDGFNRIKDAATSAYDGQTGIAKVAEAFRTIGNAAREGLDEAGNALTNAVPTVNNVTQSVNELSEALVQMGLDGEKLAEKLIEASVSIDEQYMRQAESLAEARNQQLITEQQYLEAVEQLSKEYADRKNDIAAAQLKFEEDQNRQRISNLRSTFGTIAGLQRSGSKELGAIGKAAAIGQATMDGWVAVQKALASAPPPFNFALASLVGVATAANVAKIAATPLRTGIDSVPGVGNRDNFPAMLQPGERVVPTDTNKDLKEFLSNSNKSPTITINMTVQGDILDGAEAGVRIVEKINESLQRGLARLETV